MSHFDPGCVKTRLLCYDSLVILRGKLMRRFVEQADRGQWTLLPECLDDFIDESNPVRVIDVFVEALDLAEMSFEGVEPAATGRPSYHPSVLLKLYIYGYLNRVQSNRRLEREAGRNVEVMWLLGRLAPDHKTIADFRKDNGLALRKVCARFVELCREMGLLATASVAIDGRTLSICLRRTPIAVQPGSNCHIALRTRKTASAATALLDHSLSRLLA